ncbi:tegument protein VP11/12 [Columbid alphaherpesvirus 1]|uniref:Tegument protein VP11/12 n=1 Tax=Columbid alphaherpesvirus 1 TaxID=93386 RepID=A0A1V0M8I9_9ALPH|nr:tegument protein VP11/12 [Columbid alphaherpesvirus 1]ARD71373.1 tegument protein VP11/12 [Columbid alphaherpesvirus 1]
MNSKKRTDKPPSARDLIAANALVKRRIHEGCLLPSLQTVSRSALRALEDSVEPYLPNGMLAARRDEVLQTTPGNGVPETIIIESVLADGNGSYISHYRDAVKKSLKQHGVTSDSAWTSFSSEYWKYLSNSSGLKLMVEQKGQAATSSDQRKTSVALLLRSAFNEKPVSKHPFKESSKNSVYFKTLKEMRRSMDTIQRYMYYLRPNDPMNHSPHTAVRLAELMSYVSVLYRWLLWLMDTIDGRVLKEMGYIPSGDGPRECRTPDDLFEKHIRRGPAAMAEDACASALANLTHDVLMALLKLSLLCSVAHWKRKTSGVMSAVVSTIELASLVHHHCQYIINMMFLGNVCWLEKGTNDPALQTALRNQGRYCHFLGRLAPIASSHSFAQMERGTSAWFNLAIARACVRHGGPTPHFLLSVTGEKSEPLLKAQCEDARRTDREAGSRPQSQIHSPTDTPRTLNRMSSTRRSWGGHSRAERFLVRVVGGSRKASSVRSYKQQQSARRVVDMDDLSSACAFVETSPSGNENHCWYADLNSLEDIYRTDSATSKYSTRDSTYSTNNRLLSSMGRESDSDDDQNIYVDMDELDSSVKTNGGRDMATYSITKEPISLVRARLGPLPPTPRRFYECRAEDTYDTPRIKPIPRRLSVTSKDGSVVDYDVPRPMSMYQDDALSLYDTPTVHSAVVRRLFRYSDEDCEFRSLAVGSMSRSLRSNSCLSRSYSRGSRRGTMSRLERVMEQTGVADHPGEGLAGCDKHE